MQGTFVSTMENHAIATMMTYFGSTDHGLGTEVDRVRGGGTSSKNRLESPLIYIYIYIIYIYIYIKLGKFQSQLEASHMSGYTEELWYNETVCLWMTVSMLPHTEV